MVVSTKLPQPTVRFTVSTGFSLLLLAGLDWTGTALAMPTSKQWATDSKFQLDNPVPPDSAGSKDTLPPPPNYIPASPANIQVIPAPPTGNVESLPPRQDSLPVLEASPPRQVESLNIGSSGPAVEGLQQILRSYGYNVVVDGAYGPQTAQAVRAYQRDAGLPVTGTADGQTLDALGIVNNSSGYVAAIITGWGDLATVQESFPYAERAQSRLGEYISIGRFRNRGEAESRVEQARQRGFRNTRVIHE